MINVQKSCTEPFTPIPYARKNSKRLLCGFFLCQYRDGNEVLGKKINVNEARSRTARAEGLEDREGGWTLAAAGTVINSVSAEKRWTHDTAKKAWEVPCFKTEPSKAPKIL